MRRALFTRALATIIWVGLLGADSALALPFNYATPIPGAIQAGIRQERWIDPIDIERLIKFVPSSLRAKATQEFTSWNGRHKKAPQDLVKKYVGAKNRADQQQITYSAFEEQKALAFDKLALFERYKIGHFFFAPGAKSLTARVKYLQDMFRSMDSQQKAAKTPSTLVSLFPATSEYLNALGSGTAKLLNKIGGVDCAHAEQECPPTSSPRICEAGNVCTYHKKEGFPYKPANGGPEIYQLMVEGTALGCTETPQAIAYRGFKALGPFYRIAETHYVCADPSKNVSTAPVQVEQGKVYADGVFCKNEESAPSFRTVGLYRFEDQIEDGPIPDGCVGINKVRKINTTHDLVDGSVVALNAAPCWEKHWACRYKDDPTAIVADVEKIKIPDAPVCGS